MLTRPDRSLWWSVTREWQGETAFIVGGGPSVLSQNLDLLRDRRVIAINSSYARIPFADILFFGDLRWWLAIRSDLSSFAGRIVTCRHKPCDLKGPNGQPVLSLERQRPPGLAKLPTRVVFHRTSAASAINLAAHLGCAEIVTLGLDGKFGKDGRRNHYDKAYARPHLPNTWRDQCAELATLVEPLKSLGIRVRNASPGSALDLWPIVRLEDCL